MFSTPRSIPDGISFGFSSSSYQIEGVSDGKGESIWDRFVHTQADKIKDKSDADKTCDFYTKYKEDIQTMAEMGTQVFRFSLSWSRLLPRGFVNEVNRKGVTFYNNVINELIKNGIEPVITLYHYDLPQVLQDMGGWVNPLLADYFCDFAELAFRTFGDRVNKWITFNDPIVDVISSYGLGMYAPGLHYPGIADYMAGETMLKAHARVYHLYKERFKTTQNGEIGLSLSFGWIEPKNPSSGDDIEAAKLAIEFTVGWFAHPIFSDEGGYPRGMVAKVAKESETQGYKRSRLPELSDYWTNYIRGSADFFGLNHYTSMYASFKRLAENTKHLEVKKNCLQDTKIVLSVAPDWQSTASWLYIVPWGFRKTLNWIRENCGNPKIYVTENGTPDVKTFDDDIRINYFQTYLEQMIKAVEDNCRVEMYLIRAFMDCFEWEEGYTLSFGVHEVDFSDPKRQRTERKSARYIKQVMKSRSLLGIIDLLHLSKAE